MVNMNAMNTSRTDDAKKPALQVGKAAPAAHLLLLILPLMAALWLLSGCARRTAEPETELPAQEASIQIGLSFDSFVIERWVRDRDAFVSTAQELGATVNVQNANGDSQEQVSQIEYFIKKGMDVIVIIAIDSESLVDVIAQAHAAGIKVISYDRLILGAGTDLYISFDNEAVGRLMGEALIEALPDGGRIFAIYGSPSDNNVTQVQEGLYAALENSGIEIVYENWCDNWLAELAFDAVNEGLVSAGEPDALMCGNDDLASQAIKALAEHRLAGTIPVVAQDAELSACQRIVEGTQTMTVYKSVEEEARTAARLAVALARGEDMAEAAAASGTSNLQVTTIDDGTGAIPAVCIQPVVVTAENMDEVIIGSGFHRSEDVYLNVDRDNEAANESEPESGGESTTDQAS